MAFYIPVRSNVVEAFQLTRENLKDIVRMCKNSHISVLTNNYSWQWVEDAESFGSPLTICIYNENEREIEVYEGDYIVKHHDNTLLIMTNKELKSKYYFSSFSNKRESNRYYRDCHKATKPARKLMAANLVDAIKRKVKNK